MKLSAIAFLLPAIVTTLVTAPAWQLPGSTLPQVTNSQTPKTTPWSQAEADRNSAKQQYERYKRLYQEGVISRQALAEAEAQYQIAEATYRLAIKQKPSATKVTPAMLREQRAAESSVAAAQLKLAELKYQRLIALYQRGAVSKLQLEQAQAEPATARAAYTAAIANNRNASPKKKP